jgi:crotonobetainyl-CoA:carnitine CoA-transferase CaiB-like acyl-CoA transferase
MSVSMPFSPADRHSEGEEPSVTRGAPSIGPLHGVTVLDLTSYVSGPFATMILGDLGATVIKVEDPTHGDGTRKWGPGTAGPDNGYFMSVNRNKFSVALDLNTDEGRSALMRLVSESDIFIHNMLARSEEKLQITESNIRSANPDIIYCAIAGFPQNSIRPAFDFIMQAATGLMGLTGEPGRPPVKVPFPVFDVVTAYNACIGIIAELFRRDRGPASGGRRIDVNMFDASLASMPNLIGNYLVDGLLPGRTGNVHANIAPYELFETGDGWLAIGAGTTGQWVALCHALGLTEALADERFSDNPSRIRNRAELHEIIAAVLVTDSKERWVDLLRTCAIPVTSVNALDEALQETELLRAVEHSSRGEIRLPASPIVFNNVPNLINHAPPTLGQDTADILETVGGLTSEQIEQLDARGVIRKQRTTDTE